MKRLIRHLITCFSLLLLPAGASITFIPHESGGDKRDWAFEFGVAFITTNCIDDFNGGDFNIGRGPAGGEIYVLTASRRLGELEWNIGNCTFRPQLELPFTLEIVDENSRSPFLDYNVSFNVRWIDFPWNDYVSTTFSMGLGLSYSEKVYLMDIERHPNKDRSNLKFNWPIAMTFASPRFPDHQAMIFILHQSGGRVFDKGGVNSVGFGFRRGF
ncbi:MAG: hypothetical protein ACNA8L_12770 [Luteolibacter sp.]|jgi:hypothetical protein